MLVSALTGEGIEALRAAIDAHFGAKDEVLTLEIPPGAGRLLSWLHENTEVLAQEAGDERRRHRALSHRPADQGQARKPAQARRNTGRNKGSDPSPYDVDLLDQRWSEGSDPFVWPRCRAQSFFGGGGGFVALTLGRSSMRAMNCAMCFWPSTIALLSGKRCR